MQKGMENQNNHKLSNFWLGFSLGCLTVGGVGFFLGTKKGRQTLKKLIDLSENWEENLAILENYLEEGFSGDVDKIKEELENIPQSLDHFKKNHTSLNSLLEKIKILSPQRSSKQTKKFYKST